MHHVSTQPVPASPIVPIENQNQSRNPAIRATYHSSCKEKEGSTRVRSGGPAAKNITSACSWLVVACLAKFTAKLLELIRSEKAGGTPRTPEYDRRAPQDPAAESDGRRIGVQTALGQPQPLDPTPVPIGTNGSAGVMFY
jgi:hypothetical protein